MEEQATNVDVVLTVLPIAGLLLILFGALVRRVRRSSREAGPVKSLSTAPQRPDPIPSRPTYVYTPPPAPVSTMIPPVSNTGIQIDTRQLADRLTEEQRLEVMALARTPKGKWVYSGKKLYTLFGGNYNEFVATIKRLRDGSDDDLPEEPTILTPIAQRPTKASNFQDPELAFQPPPR